jgi:rod shape-determining protein MreD
MRYLNYVVAFIVLIILQTTLVEFISIKGIKPDLIICLLVYLSMKEGALAGIFGGFLMGLSMDVYSPQTLGTGSLAKSVIGYFTGLLDERNITLDEKYKLLVLLLAAVLHQLIISILVFGLGPAIKIHLLSSILPNALYTTLVGGLFLLVISRRR